jgi:glycosyltransferase involved in cell wall biosynthesis
MSRIAILSSGFPPTGRGGVAAAHINLYAALRVVLRPGESRTGQTYDVLVGALSGWAALRKVRAFAPEILIVSDHGAPSALGPRLPGCTVVFVSHHNSARFAAEPLIRPYSARDTRLAVRAEQRAVGRADVVVCPSHYMRDMFLRTYTFSGPVHVIPNVVDLDLVGSAAARDLRREHGLGRGTPVVYIPSAGSRLKGSAYVFEVVRRIAAAHESEIAFFLSGPIPSPLARELEFLPKNARVIAPGRLAYEQNLGYVKASDLCVSPTLVESFGMALVEAQACGLPVVAFDVGGNRDVVEDTVTGMLVPFMDLEALLEGALRLLRDAGARGRAAEAARARTRDRFAPDAVAAAYVEAARERAPGGAERDG